MHSALLYGRTRRQVDRPLRGPMVDNAPKAFGATFNIEQGTARSTARGRHYTSQHHSVGNGCFERGGGEGVTNEESD
jgi:hypothetical protein